MHKYVDEKMEECVNGKTEEWTYNCLDDGWIDEQMNGLVD